jgi:2-dehydrotetronate isomerase
MPNFAANLTMMYQEVEFIERFGLAAADGFDYVEFLFPYTYPAQTIVDQLMHHGLKHVLFNFPAGDWQAGERGISILADRQKEFDNNLSVAIEYAQALDCPSIHLMAGILPEGLSKAEARLTYLKRVEQAAIALEPYDIDLMLEPINSQSIPGYFLNYQQDAIDVIQELLLPNVKLQMDFFHVQMMEGNIEQKLIRHLPHIGHIQIAGAPHRFEPSHGEINYPYLLNLLDTIGYDGFVGCEYNPQNGTSAGLAWLKAYL